MIGGIHKQHLSVVSKSGAPMASIGLVWNLLGALIQPTPCRLGGPYLRRTRSRHRPPHPGNASPFLLDRPAFEEFSRRYSGTRLYVPMAKREIARLWARKGDDLREVALALDVSRRTLRRYVKG